MGQGKGPVMWSQLETSIVGSLREFWAQRTSELLSAPPPAPSPISALICGGGGGLGAAPRLGSWETPAAWKGDLAKPCPPQASLTWACLG